MIANKWNVREVKHYLLLIESTNIHWLPYSIPNTVIGIESSWRLLQILATLVYTLLVIDYPVLFKNY